MTSGQIAEDLKLAPCGNIAAQATGSSAISRSNVKKLQKALNKSGFSVGPAALNLSMPDRVRRLVCFANSLPAYILPRVVAASPKSQS